MTHFRRLVTAKLDEYIRLRKSLGHSFCKQSATLNAFRRFIGESKQNGPLTGKLVLEFALTSDVTPNERAGRYGVVRQFAEYFSIFDPTTEPIDAHALPRSRAIPPPRILDDAELARLLRCALENWHHHPIQGLTLFTVLGLLASTGLRSGEALRLDRADVDLTSGVLVIRQSKFRKDRLVPVHSTTCEALRAYASTRDTKFRHSTSPAFFVSIRGGRLSPAGLSVAFRKACDRARLNEGSPRPVRPHDLRHRFATRRLALWHRERVDVQARLPLLATYLGHARYSDTAYYVTGTAELLGAAAERAFGRKRDGR